MNIYDTVWNCCLCSYVKDFKWCLNLVLKSFYDSPLSKNGSQLYTEKKKKQTVGDLALQKGVVTFRTPCIKGKATSILHHELMTLDKCMKFPCKINWILTTGFMHIAHRRWWLICERGRFQSPLADWSAVPSISGLLSLFRTIETSQNWMEPDRIAGQSALGVWSLPKQPS